MTDAVRALLAGTPALQRASRLGPARLPVLPAFEQVLPFGGLRPGTTIGVSGVAATSVGLSLVSRASQESWTAAVGLPALGIRAAEELGVALDRLTVVPDPGGDPATILAALVDAFDIVVAPSVRTRDARRIGSRVRERDALLVVIGSHPECDVSLHGSAATWQGMGHGHGSLRSRLLEVTVAGRGAASRSIRVSLWLPDREGEVTLATDVVVPMRGTEMA